MIPRTKIWKHHSHISWWKFSLRCSPTPTGWIKKLLDSPFINELDVKHFTYLRNVKKNIDLFEEKYSVDCWNLNVLQQQFGVIAGKMTVNVNGQEYTLQQAARFLEDPDRNLREEVYHKINKRRLEDKVKHSTNCFLHYLPSVMK